MLKLGSLESGKLLWVEFVEDLGVDPGLPSEYAHTMLDTDPAGDTGTEVSGDAAGLRFADAEAEAGTEAGTGAGWGGEDGREAAMGFRVGESGEAATDVGEITSEGEVGELMPGRTGRLGIDMGGRGGSGAFQGLALEAAVGVGGVEAALTVVIIVAAFCLSAPGCCDPAVLSQLGASTADLGAGGNFGFACCGGGGGGAVGGLVGGPEIPVRAWIGATGSFLSNGLKADVADVGVAAMGVVVVVGGADLGGAGLLVVAPLEVASGDSNDWSGAFDWAPSKRSNSESSSLGRSGRSKSNLFGPALDGGVGCAFEKSDLPFSPPADRFLLKKFAAASMMESNYPTRYFFKEPSLGC